MIPQRSELELTPILTLTLILTQLPQLLRRIQVFSNSIVVVINVDAELFAACKGRRLGMRARKSQVSDMLWC